MVAYCDKTVGRFLDALDRWQLRQNTLVIFTADNGAEHTILSQLNGRAIRGDKGRPTAAGTHVPLIVAGPGIPGGRVINDLVDFTDFLPTLADAIGAHLPRSRGPLGRLALGRLRAWVYRFALERGYLDALLAGYVVAPVVRLFRFCDGLERRWTDFLAGRASRESGQLPPSAVPVEELP